MHTQNALYDSSFFLVCFVGVGVIVIVPVAAVGTITAGLNFLVRDKPNGQLSTNELCDLPVNIVYVENRLSVPLVGCSDQA